MALRSDEVLELMVEEYPPKYDEYMDVVQQREFQEALRKKVIETKRVALREAHVSSFCSAMGESAAAIYLHCVLCSSSLIPRLALTGLGERKELGIYYLCMCLIFRILL